MAEAVDHPAHYGGADNPYEAIKVIEAWGLGFHLGNTVKYVSRAGKKSAQTLLEDLRKARWYLDREVTRLEQLAAKARTECPNGPEHAPGECELCDGVFCVHGTDCTDSRRCAKCDRRRR